MLKKLALEAQQLFIDRGYDVKLEVGKYNNERSSDCIEWDVIWVRLDNHSGHAHNCLGIYENGLNIGAIIATYGSCCVYNDKPLWRFDIASYVEMAHRTIREAGEDSYA